MWSSGRGCIPRVRTSALPFPRLEDVKGRVAKLAPANEEMEQLKLGEAAIRAAVLQKRGLTNYDPEPAVGAQGVSLMTADQQIAE